MTAHPDDIDKRIKETASYWIVRLSSPDCTPEDRYAFEAWRRADPEHQIAYDKQKRGEAFVDRNVSDPLLQALAEEVREETEPQWRRRRFAAFSAIAASLAVVVAASILFYNSAMRPNHGNLTIAGMEAFRTAVGERSTVTLSDGTALTLNTNSEAAVDFTEEERTVILQRGQALFEVAHDLERPFVVEAGGRRIVALGTAFDVRLDDGVGVQVTLIEGKIAVDEVDRPDGQPTGKLSSNPKESFELEPGDRLIARLDTPVQVAKADIEEVTSWRDGRLVFRSKPLPDVIDEMNRYSGQKLVLGDDERLRDMTVSGVFDTGRTSGFVYALETMHPLKAERTGRKELTLVWRE